MKNKWKIGFIVLLGINLLFAIILLTLILVPADVQKSNKSKELAGEYVSFHIQSNKSDLNRLINHYLAEETSDSPIDYRILINEDVELLGTIPVFSEEINLQLSFEPEVLENGDLVLKQKSMSVGSLPLPISYVLKFISQNYKLPNGVEIKPDDKQIYVQMQEIKLKSDMKIKVNQFDLKKDQIEFVILVPVT